MDECECECKCKCPGSSSGETGDMIAAFCALQRDWLEQELQQPSSSTTKVKDDDNGSASRMVQALHGLEVAQASVGLYGRTVLEFVVSTKAAAMPQPPESSSSSCLSTGASSAATIKTTTPLLLLPSHRFTTGDEVEIRHNNKQSTVAASGVISAVTETSLSVAVTQHNKNHNDKNNTNNTNKTTNQSQSHNSKTKKAASAATPPNGDDTTDTDAFWHTPNSTTYSLLARSNVQVHHKLLAALHELETKNVHHPVCGRIVQALFSASENDTSSFGLKPNDKKNTTIHGEAAVRLDGGGIDPNPNKPPSSAPSSSCNESASEAAAAAAAIPSNRSTSPLDDSQREAIAFALSNNNTRCPIALIHGPPGTGKTTTLVELVRQAVCEHGYKVLVTAPSNVAVDNVLSRLIAAADDTDSSTTRRQQRKNERNHTSTNNNNRGPRQRRRLQLVRLGHPARLQPAILPYCLEALVQSADGADIVKDVRDELEGHFATLNNNNHATSRSSHSNSNNSGSQKQRQQNKRLAYSEVKAMRKELRVREEKAVADVLERANVVLSTCVGAGNAKLLESLSFDLVVIDEAAQALEAACWIPALQARSKLVLAGDHLQLPPTIMSNIPAVQSGLSRTMFERVMALYENKDPRQPGVERVSRMLKVQYRMHEKIANWASQALYGGELQTHASVKSRTLSQLVAESNATSEESDVTNLHQSTLLLIDTSGYDMHESTNAVGSRFNEGEAQLVVTHVRKLLAMGIPADQIAVISPYNGQVEVLRLALLPEAPTLQIRSVDGFQGGEREAVVISLVRSSSRGGMNGIGFLRDDRRLNVAVTRAKRHCCVICDAETVSQSPFVKSLINWIETHGEVMSPDDDDQMKADLEQAEHELCRLVESESMRISSSRCETNSAIPESRRLALTEIIRSFQVDAIPSESMVMSLELTKLDRKTVHEIAEEIGLGHRSEGVEGIDRRITLFVPERPITHSAEQLAAPFRKVLLDDADTVLVEQNGKCSVAVIVPSLDTQNLTEGKTEANTSVAVIEQESDSDDEDVIATTGQRGDTLTGYVEESQQLSTSQFALLNATAEDDDDVEEHDDVEDLDHISSNHEFNSVLGSLAKQRSERGRYRQKSDEKPKTKPKKGKQLGGSKKSAAPVDDALHEMDDFAFLDAQIDKVQNSHGRQVVGTGKTYRTIVNGVLLARPKAAEKKKNSNASTALNAMLRDAKNDRKSKQNK